MQFADNRRTHPPSRGPLTVVAPLACRAVTNVKARIAALGLLDRALANLADDELLIAIQALPEDHLTALGKVAGYGDDAADGDQIDAVRATAKAGRINGDLERLALVLTDAALAECITELGDAADNPSEDDLHRVLPGIVETYGLHLTQVMMASVVVGEAPASPTLIRILKHDETYALPAAPERDIVPQLAAPTAEEQAEREAIRERRKAERKRKQAEQAARRAQAARRT